MCVWPVIVHHCSDNRFYEQKTLQPWCNLWLSSFSFWPLRVVHEYKCYVKCWDIKMMWYCASSLYHLTTETKLLSSHQSHALSKVFFVFLWFPGWVYTNIKHKIGRHTCESALYQSLLWRSTKCLSFDCNALFKHEWWEFLTLSIVCVYLASKHLLIHLHDPKFSISTSAYFSMWMRNSAGQWNRPSCLLSQKQLVLKHAHSDICKSQYENTHWFSDQASD